MTFRCVFNCTWIAWWNQNINIWQIYIYVCLHVVAYYASTHNHDCWYMLRWWLRHRCINSQYRWINIAVEFVSITARYRCCDTEAVQMHVIHSRRLRFRANDVELILAAQGVVTRVCERWRRHGVWCKTFRLVLNKSDFVTEKVFPKSHTTTEYLSEPSSRFLDVLILGDVRFGIFSLHNKIVPAISLRFYFRPTVGVISPLLSKLVEANFCRRGQRTKHAIELRRKITLFAKIIGWLFCTPQRCDTCRSSRWARQV